MTKAIIFDADGVLLDNTEIYIKAYQETGKKLGLKIPSDSEVRKTFGPPWEEMLIKLYGKINEDMKKTYVEICRKLEPQIKAMDNLEYVLKKLEIRKAIATSKSRETLKRQLRNLIRFFEVIISREDTKKHKPDPEPLSLACKMLCIKPKEAIYVGDAVIDYEAAKNAGTGFVGFISGSASKEEFEALNIKFITSLKDLLREFQ